MDNVSDADHHRMLACEGWLELGLPRECLGELRGLSAGARAMPLVLNLEWRAHADLKDWPASLDVGLRMVREHPAEVAGWIQRSFALHELGRTPEAMQALAVAADNFPEHPVVRYNMACYACRLGDKDAARQWLREVVRLKGTAYVKDLAADDDDLASLRDEILSWASD